MKGPEALRQSTQQGYEYWVMAFYKYVIIDDPENFKEEHREFCKNIGIKTRIIVADEGINGVVSGSIETCRQYIKALTSIPKFSDINFKIDEVGQPAVRRTRVLHKQEIVNSGIGHLKDEISPFKKTGEHIDPKDFKRLKDRDDVVVVDVRSDYEHAMGSFKNAVKLDISNFREFPDQLEALEPYKDKKIITYCTGGIKCEKATSLLLKQGFKDVGQLKGGIIQYAKEAKGEDFKGKCYVFDERVVVDVNDVNPELISPCQHCGQKTDRIINCANPDCHDQVIVCEDCGWAWKGTCCQDCYDHPDRRPYDGTGYYPKDKRVQRL